MSDEITRLKAMSHPLRLQILVVMDAMGEARTSDLASEIGAAANKVSYHLSILHSGGFINKRVGDDARETWWSVNETRINPPEPDPSERGSEDGRAASLAILEYLRDESPTSWTRTKTSPSCSRLRLSHPGATSGGHRGSFGTVSTNPGNVGRESRKRGGGPLRAWRTAPPGTRRARISSSNMLLPVSLGE